MVDRQCRESEGKVKIEGYMSISDEEAHHPLSTKIVTVLSHIAWRMLRYGWQGRGWQ